MLKESEIKILNYLTLRPEGAGTVSQISRDIGLSKGQVSKVLKVLKGFGFIRVNLTGRNLSCSIDPHSAAIKKLRLAFNLIEIDQKMAVLRDCSDKIVLFGSCAQGTDTVKSDIDLLIISRDKAKATRVANAIKMSRDVQWVIKTPQEYIILNKKEPVFAEELANGITLWETHEPA